jgi:hypothetical protein
MNCGKAQISIPTVDLTPSVEDIEIQRWSRETFEAILTNGRTPIDISTDIVRFTVKDSSGQVKLQKSNGPGSHFDPENGCTVFVIGEDDLSDPNEEFEWQFEIRRIDLLAHEFVHIAGNFTVKPGVGD